MPPYHALFPIPGLQSGVYQASRNLAATKDFSVKLVTHTQLFVLQDPLNLSATVAMYVKLHNLGLQVTKQASAGESCKWTRNLKEQQRAFLRAPDLESLVWRTSTRTTYSGPGGDFCTTSLLN